MRWFLFGHAIFEKSLAPFEGITARGVLFEANDALLALPLALRVPEASAPTPTSASVPVWGGDTTCATLLSSRLFGASASK
jgi:hypothetical protein